MVLYLIVYLIVPTVQYSNSAEHCKAMTLWPSFKVMYGHILTIYKIIYVLSFYLPHKVVKW